MTQNVRSLVLITVDCLRADHCGLYGYSLPTTPFLDSLASESFVVPQATVAGAPTYYSLPAIFASRMPLALGRDVIGLAPGESALATVLRESGCATGAFSAGNPYISQRFGYDQGFDVFRDFLDFEVQSSRNTASLENGPALARGKLNRAIKNIAGTFGFSRLYNELYFQYCMKIASAAESIDTLRRFPAADILVEQAQEWLASVGQRPVFLWLHLMDAHSPYYPRDEAFRALTGRDIASGHARYLNAYWNRSDLAPIDFREKRDEIVQLYDAGVHWVDRQIARLVDSLRRTSRWDDCVFAVTADHGEEFLEHGGRYHAPLHLSNEIVRVPLLIRVPRSEGRGVKVPASPMSHLHLAPTLLDFMGLPVPSAFQGRSLRTNLQGGTAWDDPAIIECAYGCTNPFRAESRSAPRLLGVRDARFKMVMKIQQGATEEVYDLEADPAEIHPRAEGLGVDVRRRLLQAAREHMESTVSARDPVKRLRAQLRDLRCETLG
ncbi:MAG: sulfatase-like hydrolase/transferase [Terriglobales bacterium]